MNLNFISALIVDAGLGVEGDSLFLHHMPETCQRGILLRLPLQGIPINHYIPNYCKGSFQLIVRARDHASGEALAKQVSALLNFFDRDFTDEGGNFAMRINHCYPRVKPIVYPRLPNNSVEWSITFDVNYIEG